MIVLIGVDAGARAARHVKVKVVYLKMLIFKAKISTIPLALNIINCSLLALRLNRGKALEFEEIEVAIYSSNTYVHHIYGYYITPETPIISSVMAHCPDCVPLNIF